MWRFAWRNILTRPTRTLLALIGLSIPILGVVGLFSLSNGLRMLVGNTLNQIQGVIVLRNNAPSPVFSDIPADLPDKIRAMPGVKVVSPEIWGISPPIENTSLIARTISNLGDQQKRQEEGGKIAQQQHFDVVSQSDGKGRLPADQPCADADP